MFKETSGAQITLIGIEVKGVVKSTPFSSISREYVILNMVDSLKASSFEATMSSACSNSSPEISEILSQKFLFILEKTGSMLFSVTKIFSEETTKACSSSVKLEKS